MRTSRSPTTVMTANGEVQTREEATVYVKEVDLFVTVMLLEETPAVLSLGKLREDHRYTYHISPKRARKLIAMCQTMCHSLSLVDSVFGTEIQQQKEVEVRVRIYGEKTNRNRKQKYKWRTLRSTKRSVARLAGLAAGVHRKFGQ